MLIKYYVTFGFKSPFRDGWVLIEAFDEIRAIKEANYTLGSWYMIYEESIFNKDLFPSGQIGYKLVAMES